MIEVESSDAARVITICRPERRNALDDGTVTRIRAEVRAASADEAVRALIFTGEGGLAFCSGSDLKAAQLMSPAERTAHAKNGQEMMDEINSSPLLTIAAVEGWALGGGLELALACDLVIASETAKFGLPEVQKATIPSWGGTHRVTRAVGLSTAKNMLLGGRTYTGAEAFSLGLALELVTAGGALDAARAVAERMCSGSSRGVLATAKGLLNDGAHRAPGLSSKAEFDAECELAALEGYGKAADRGAS